MYSSYIFEISLQKTIFLPLKLFFNSGITLFIFLGEIKKTNDPSNLENFFKSGLSQNRAFVKTYLKPDNNTVGLDKIVDVINKNFFN